MLRNSHSCLHSCSRRVRTDGERDGTERVLITTVSPALDPLPARFDCQIPRPATAIRDNDRRTPSRCAPPRRATSCCHGHLVQPRRSFQWMPARPETSLLPVSVTKRPALASPLTGLVPQRLAVDGVTPSESRMTNKDLMANVDAAGCLKSLWPGGKSAPPARSFVTRRHRSAMLPPRCGTRIL